LRQLSRFRQLCWLARASAIDSQLAEDAADYAIAADSSARPLRITLMRH
jgi:hypothetical protein